MHKKMTIFYLCQTSIRFLEMMIFKNGSERDSNHVESLLRISEVNLKIAPFLCCDFLHFSNMVFHFLLSAHFNGTLVNLFPLIFLFFFLQNISSNKKNTWSELLSFQVLIALMLFFGHLRTSMNHNEFVSAMGLIGVFGAIHMFSWLVVFQFRKNLLEEQRLMARLVASAPLPPGTKRMWFHVKFHDFTKFFPRLSDDPPTRQERAPSPPPAYDEVTKAVSETGISDIKLDFGSFESPPDYEVAIAMCRATEPQMDASQVLT